MAHTSSFYVYLFSNEMQNKVATSRRKWRENGISEFWKLLKTLVDGEWCFGALRHHSESVTMASSCFQVSPVTVQTSNRFDGPSQEAAELRSRHVEGRAEKKRSQFMGEHHTILPSIALQKHTEAYES